jgi:hypothetical protein
MLVAPRRGVVRDGAAGEERAKKSDSNVVP